MKLSKIKLSMLLLCLTAVSFAQELALDTYKWTMIDTQGEVKGRHEDSFIEYKNKFYLMGGRGINPVNVFDPSTNTWETKGNSPMEIHHFQAVVYKDVIYLMGAMTGRYPKEIPLTNIWKYYPETDKWEEGDEIPVDRRRGGAGTVVYKDKIYMACGIDYGHTSGTNNNFDCYDPNTGEWKTLTKAPNIRDHFPAIVVNDKMYCVGGRNTSFHTEKNFGAFFDATMPYVDVYDFEKETWYTMDEKIPFPTAAGGLVNINNNLIYIGGEGSRKQAFNNTQCLDLSTGKWTQLAHLTIGRHGSGAIFYDNKIYTAAGSMIKGGSNMNSIEVFSGDHTWQSLFNGENLDGWEVFCTEKDKSKNYWYVEDGLLVCNTQGRKDHKYIWLQSVNEYDDFELRFKFLAYRDNKGNSGIQIRSRYDKDATEGGDGELKGWMNGPQVDIEPNNPWRNGFIYDETIGYRRWIYPSLPNWNISETEYAPKRVIFYWEDEKPAWNDMYIVCKGNRITTYVNNIQVTDQDFTGILDDKIHKKQNVGIKGHLAFQLHMNGINNLRFKDIEIRTIK